MIEDCCVGVCYKLVQKVIFRSLRFSVAFPPSVEMALRVISTVR